MSDFADAPNPKMSLWDFNADTPIFSEWQDTLHRAAFAKQIAQVLLQTRSIKYSDPNKTPEQVIEELESGKIPIPESYTIAVLGSWGSGKTSLKNLICKDIESAGSSRPHISSFEPLRWRDEDSLILDFFKTLAKEVGNEDNKNAKEAARELLQLGDYFALANIAALSGGAAGVALGLTTSHSSIVLIGCIATLFMKGSRFLTERGRRILNEAKGLSLVDKIDISVEILRKRMLRLDAPVIMFIDDIDRLTPKEVTFLFQLLKFNANFPNVFYVLLGQRDVIEGGLEKLYPGYGGQYLEKFVQLAIDLPQVEMHDIRKIVLNFINDLAQQLGYEPIWIQRELDSIYELGIAPYLTSLRKLNRYINSLQFLISLCKNEGGEKVVHPVDFAVLEIIRLYEPNVYQDLHRNKLLLTGSFFDVNNVISKMTQNLTDESSEKENTEEIVEVETLRRLLDKSTNAGALKVLLTALSPDVKDLYKYLDTSSRSLSSGKDSTQKGGFFRNRNALDERFNNFRSFDRYFLFRIEHNRLTPEEKDDLISSISNRESLLKNLRSLLAKGKFDDTMAEIHSAVSNLNIGNIEEFIAAIIDWADEMPQPEWQPYSVSGITKSFEEIIMNALAKKNNIEEAVSSFEIAAKNAAGIYLIFQMARRDSMSLMLLGEAFPEIRKTEESERRDSIMDRITQITKIAEERIEIVTSGNSVLTRLEDRASFGLILQYWINSNEEACKMWVKKLLLQPKAMAAFARAMASHREYDDETLDNESYPSSSQFFSLLKMENLISLEDLNSIIGSVSIKELNLSEILWVKTLKDAIKRNQEGEKLPYMLLGECPDPRLFHANATN